MRSASTSIGTPSSATAMSTARWWSLSSVCIASRTARSVSLWSSSSWTEGLSSIASSRTTSRPCHARLRALTEASSRTNLYAHVVKRLSPRKVSSLFSTATSASLAASCARSSISPGGIRRRCSSKYAPLSISAWRSSIASARRGPVSSAVTMSRSRRDTRTSYRAPKNLGGGLQALRAHTHDVPRQPARLERAAHRRRRVELPAAEPVGRRGRKRVVVVVPRLPERGQREPEDVARLVARRVRAAPERVADRVDAVGDVVQGEHPDPAAPQQAGQRGLEAAADEPPEPEGEREPADRPDEERAVDERDHRVAQQVGRVAGARAALVMAKQPADVGVQQAAQRTAQADAVVDVRAVRVARPVRERVVLAVVGDPRDHRPLDRRRAEDRETAAHHAAGLEAAVREQAVEADGHAEAGERVDDREDGEVARVQEAV